MPGLRENEKRTSTTCMVSSKNDIFIFAAQQVPTALVICCRFGRLKGNIVRLFSCSCGFPSSGIPLLLPLYLLQPVYFKRPMSTILLSLGLPNTPEELLPIHFIKLTQDILDSILQSRYNNMLNCVHAPICSANDLIQDGKGCLERS